VQFRAKSVQPPQPQARSADSHLKRPQPSEERKGKLEHPLRKTAAPGILFNEHLVGDGATIFQHARKLGLRV
jgi:ATP-dependent DNA ligase